MSIQIEKLVGPMVLPAALVGLSTNVFTDLFPGVSWWIGRVGLVALGASCLAYFLRRITHQIVPLRFANLIYLLNESEELATIVHPYHKRVQPPGSRLRYHEGPHQAIPRVLRDELGLDPKHVEVEVWTARNLGKSGNVETVASPIHVQVEWHEQRLGVKAHYDYVYLCRVKGSPSIQSDLDAQWKSLDELVSLQASDSENRPFRDVIETYERIVKTPPDDRHWQRLVG